MRIPLERRVRSPAELALELGLRRTLDKIFQDWMENKTAEYQMQGFGLTEAKEKAMSDWHTYGAANE